MYACKHNEINIYMCGGWSVCVCGVCVLVQVLVLVWVMVCEGKCWGVGNGTLPTT